MIERLIYTQHWDSERETRGRGTGQEGRVEKEGKTDKTGNGGTKHNLETCFNSQWPHASNSCTRDDKTLVLLTVNDLWVKFFSETILKLLHRLFMNKILILSGKKCGFAFVFQVSGLIFCPRSFVIWDLTLLIFSQIHCLSCWNHPPHDQ